MFKKNNGITLIALIVTILVILILVGIGINFLVGENGILDKAKNASDSSQEGSKIEEEKLAKYNNILNNNGINTNVENVGPDYSDFQTKEENGELWVRVFYHNISVNKTFFTPSEALNCNTDNKYSSLDRLEEFRNGDGNFEFKLEYPELNQYNRWIQKSNPTKAVEVVSGYKAVQIASTQNSWNGICKSNSNSCFIDGSVGVSQWYYSIGCYSSTWSDTIGKVGIPSYTAAVNEVILWVRADNLSKMNIAYETKEKDNATWLKLVYQNINNGTNLFTTSEMNFCDKQGKYSILGEIEKYRDKNNNFEFMLEYPEFNQYNRWIQTSNPCEVVESVTGYEPIQITWKTQYWNGICKSNSGACFIDGSVGIGSWFYAVGSYTPWTASNNAVGLPPYNSNLAANEVYLWVRIDNLNADKSEQIKTAYGAQWKEMQYLNIAKSGSTFFTTSNVLDCNDYYRYSKLGQLETYRGDDGKFEFLLELPDYDGYNRWKQTTNPVTTLESITGYTPIQISFSTNGWNGIAKSNSGACLIDGNVGSGNWFYGIGQYAIWLGGIPANVSGSGINSIKLWVRTDN